MNNNDNNNELDKTKQKITVESASVEGIVRALGMELVERKPSEETPGGYPPALAPAFSALADVYAGVETATEKDSRGRSRKMVRDYADREDLSSDAVGHHLRVLEEHGLVVQDGNRWRVKADDGEA